MQNYYSALILLYYIYYVVNTIVFIFLHLGAWLEYINKHTTDEFKIILIYV